MPSPLNKTERAVLLEIIQSKGMLRSGLSGGLGLSKATVSIAVKRLQDAGLVVAFDTTQGQLGRPASFHRVATTAGCCVGLDLGTTRARGRAVALDGRLLSESELSVRASTSEIGTASLDAACQVVRDVGKELAALDAPVRRLVLAAPIRVAYDKPLPKKLAALLSTIETLPTHHDFHLEVENNVNCSAVAEGSEGAARGYESFALLQVGVKVGLGIMHGGRLFRGGRGGAGEVSYIPYPWHEGGLPVRMSLEGHLGSAQLTDRARKALALGAHRRPGTKELFSKARAGDLSARQVVNDHAREIGQLAAAVVAMIDPPLIVLGGGVGQNDLLVDGVRSIVQQLTWPTEVVPGLLGQRATVLGAVQLAIGATLQEVLEARY